MVKPKVEKETFKINLPEGSAILFRKKRRATIIKNNRFTKWFDFRKYNKMLCEHVYMHFCQNCPLYLCNRRAI